MTGSKESICTPSSLNPASGEEMMAKRKIPNEAIVKLRQKLEQQPPYSSERRELIQETANFYGVSIDTIYRVLRERKSIKSARRIDYGQPRVMPKTTLERYCEVIAALKVRTQRQKRSSSLYQSSNSPLGRRRNQYPRWLFTSTYWTIKEIHC